MEPVPRLDALARQVVSAAIEVHRHLGPGYLESLYEEAPVIELTARGVAYARQPPIRVRYKGKAIGEGRADLLIGGELSVELKAVDQVAPIHKVQLISYLKAMQLHLGLLINFNVAVLRDGVQRVVLSAP